ncbi:hypothetical protein ELI_4526 [Eubacterium callanderi]|uniref:Uncharacterized protein n=1 Tax=Eubacterium callanderi TaxID=53442 RepID=E3GR18_9FIRM|nr:hypothetical protein ELI_4526 [Eubacterium callanderi]
MKKASISDMIFNNRIMNGDCNNE